MNLTPPVAARQASVRPWLAIRHLYVSPGHNFFGRHGQPPERHPIIQAAQIQCVTGRGIRGDRFFDHRENYKGQITFFAVEVYHRLCEALSTRDLPPSVFRRNVVTEGADLNSLIGAEFELQGVRFRGTEECRPCAWMNQAFAPGAEKLLRGQGGLRAMILSDGILRAGTGDTGSHFPAESVSQDEGQRQPGWRQDGPA
jgi:hypothetical protein